jgi:hypothetical protein
MQKAMALRFSTSETTTSDSKHPSPKRRNCFRSFTSSLLPDLITRQASLSLGSADAYIFSVSVFSENVKMI